MWKIHQKTILVTLDVKALYTNILKHEGIKAVKETPNTEAKKPIATQVIIKFLYLVLTLSNLVFNGINHLQKKGCAMGTNFSYGMEQNLN